ncbi:MAG: HEAT repeat domain-containing protein [Planctomycetes bacterium]|nr:HEAT repeat domain-containing protein [Planctomycetota bacterium]
MSGRSRKILVAISCFAAVFCACRKEPTGSSGLSAGQQMELRTWQSQLSDPGRDQRERVEAARQMLSAQYPQAMQVLKETMEDDRNPSAQQAVAIAVAWRGTGPAELFGPLLAALASREGMVRSAAAQALAVYRGDETLGKVMAIARDVKAGGGTRLAAIASIQKVLDKRGVEALIGLLDDSDNMVRAAAEEALVKLTGIRSFGADRQQWQGWWEKNRDKDASDWVNDMTEGLARSKAALEAENEILRKRLIQAIESVLASLPAGQQRTAKVLDLLKDPVAEARLVAIKAMEQLSGGGPGVPADMLIQLRLLLTDPDARVRQASAAMLAALNDADAIGLLLGRLKVEDSPAVRQEILKSLGQIGDTSALSQILNALNSQVEDIASAAAIGLTRIAMKKPLDPSVLVAAEEILVKRLAGVEKNKNSTELRESLLQALGAVGGQDASKALREALKDPSARIRLAAVGGLKQMRATDAVAGIEPLAADSDKGVRQAAIETLAWLGGEKYLPTILKRADSAAETDAAVRQKAWDAVMAICSKSDEQTLRDVLRQLGGMSDSAAQQIRLRQILVDRLRSVKSPNLSDALLELGQSLVKSGRPAEAAPLLEEACTLCKEAGSPKASAVWLEWVDSLLAADDPRVAKVIAQQANNADFTAGLDKLNARLALLESKANWSALVRLADEAVRELQAKIAPRTLDAIKAMRDKAAAQQVSQDRQRVAGLAGQLVAADEAARKAASDELKAMGDRAVGPLLDELKKALAEEKVNATAEKAILDILKQIAPKLKDYDPAAAKDLRLKLVNSWIEGLKGANP